MKQEASSGTEPIGRPIDFVVLATDQATDIDSIVRRLHDHLSTKVSVGCAGDTWRIIVADCASVDETFEAAAGLAGGLPAVSTVRLECPLDQQALRARFAATEADMVVFLRLDPTTDLDRLMAPLSSMHRPPRIAGSSSAADRPSSAAPSRKTMTRRGALTAIGGVGLTALLAACGSDGNAATSKTSGPATMGPATSLTTSTGPATSPAASSGSTTLAVEMTQGPYYLDLNKVRSDIREDREGAALALAVDVINAAGTPINGAVVDIWHCDANGIYSGFGSASTGGGGAPGGGGPPGGPGPDGSQPGGPGGTGGFPAGGGTPGGGGAAAPTDSMTFLRGTQLTDVAGRLAFTTIYPGWYPGRNVHIHVMVHVGGKVRHIGQLFFDDVFTDGVYQRAAPYSRRPTRDTRNENDSIFAGGGAKSVLTVTPDGAGYRAAITMMING